MGKMRNLVVGSEGFVGRSLCCYLERLGETVVHFDIKRGTLEDARFAKLPLDEVDRVYFLAWEVGGAKYLYRKDVQFRQLDWNLQLMLNVMPQIRESNLPFLFVSSQLAEEYDTVYGATKRLGEIWTHLMEGVRVRLWNVYGGYEDMTERSHVISDFVHQALNDRRIAMLTTGKEVRQFIYIEDVCNAMHKAINEQLQGIYDISSMEWVSVRTVAEIIGELTGAEICPGTKEGSTPFTPMVGKIPNWYPEVSLHEGLGRMIADWRQSMGANNEGG